jgi:hypothetical protein
MQGQIEKIGAVPIIRREAPKVIHSHTIICIYITIGCRHLFVYYLNTLTPRRSGCLCVSGSATHYQKREGRRPSKLTEAQERRRQAGGAAF